MKEPKLRALMKNRPTVAMNSSGTNFRITVTTWKPPRFRTPEMLMRAGIHRPTSAIATEPQMLPPLLTNTST